jgi:Fur family ferric uptake transcriptional regulator
MKKEIMKKSRLTKQRQVILEELMKLTSHPTADELYHIVRRRLPTISLGTVYRNLDLLSKKNVIRKLDISGKRARFDANTNNHHHIRCLRCDRVDDIFNLPEIEIEKYVSKATNYEVLGYNLEYLGICPECKKLSKK